MRKILIAIATAALVAAPMTAAEAASSYRVSASSSDNKLDLTSHDGSNRSTVIKGTVRGGKVKGQKVYLYASNTSARNQSYRYIGSDRLSSSGRFAKKWKPKDGGLYRVKVVKRAGQGKRAGQDVTKVYVYRFTNLARFFAGGAGVTRPDKATSAGGGYWSTAYEIPAGSSATFATQGYACFRINFKIGVSDRTGGSGSYRVSQGGRTIKAGSLSRGDRFVEPTKTETKRMRANDPVVVTATGTTMVLGNPKAACTYPAKSAAVR
ncbi:hypothetical protein [Aeromicrobium sp. Root472D3]|uniref:hypothetical protein n=1 Tax=Aeromicrobium sp. Root472D3 TaxID=1736540 RepID=UPI0006F60A08|nr:hypothetical protein [Aeromicrobium sp. Root472D3]KQX74037.1 hypothetical protein ASD10_01890 [Aeromicrobium sp. Root472D3]